MIGPSLFISRRGLLGAESGKQWRLVCSGQLIASFHECLIMFCGYFPWKAVNWKVSLDNHLFTNVLCSGINFEVKIRHKTNCNEICRNCVKMCGSRTKKFETFKYKCEPACTLKTYICARLQRANDINNHKNVRLQQFEEMHFPGYSQSGLVCCWRTRWGW